MPCPVVVGKKIIIICVVSKYMFLNILLIVRTEPQKF